MHETGLASLLLILYKVLASYRKGGSFKQTNKHTYGGDCRCDVGRSLADSNSKYFNKLFRSLEQAYLMMHSVPGHRSYGPFSMLSNGGSVRYCIRHKYVIDDDDDKTTTNE